MARTGKKPETARKWCNKIRNRTTRPGGLPRKEGIHQRHRERTRREIQVRKKDLAALKADQRARRESKALSFRQLSARLKYAAKALKVHPEKWPMALAKYTCFIGLEKRCGTITETEYAALTRKVQEIKPKKARK